VAGANISVLFVHSMQVLSREDGVTMRLFFIIISQNLIRIERRWKLREGKLRSCIFLFVSEKIWMVSWEELNGVVGCKGQH